MAALAPGSPGCAASHDLLEGRTAAVGFGWPVRRRSGYHAFLAQFFTRPQPVATLSIPAQIRNQERVGPVHM
jgi:hypothetical protein